MGSGISSVMPVADSSGVVFMGPGNLDPNSLGSYSYSAGPGLQVGWNSSGGGRDVTLINNDSNGTGGFIWKQRTGDSSSRTIGSLDGSGTISVNKLCIGSTCIDESYLKILTGAQAVNVKSSQGRYLSDQNKTGGFVTAAASWEQMYIQK